MASCYSVIPVIRKQSPSSTAGKFWNAEGLKRTNTEKSDLDCRESAIKSLSKGLMSRSPGQRPQAGSTRGGRGQRVLLGIYRQKEGQRQSDRDTMSREWSGRGRKEEGIGWSVGSGHRGGTSWIRQQIWTRSLLWLLELETHIPCTAVWRRTGQNEGHGGIHGSGCLPAEERGRQQDQGLAAEWVRACWTCWDPLHIYHDGKRHSTAKKTNKKNPTRSLWRLLLLRSCCVLTAEKRIICRQWLKLWSWPRQHAVLSLVHARMHARASL